MVGNDMYREHPNGVIWCVLLGSERFADRRCDVLDCYDLVDRRLRSSATVSRSAVDYQRSMIRIASIVFSFCPFLRT